MAPSDSPLKAIRRQAAEHQRITAPANIDSAYNRLKRSNDGIDGKEPPNVYRATTPPGSIVIAPAPKKRLKTRIGTFSVAHPKPSTPKPRRKRTTSKRSPSAPTAPRPFPSPEPEPNVESWRLTYGAVPSSSPPTSIRVLPTATLGIARISTWRVETFTETLMRLLRKHGAMGELQTSELVHGGESVTDVLVVFTCETLAEAVKEKIDGEVVEGRRLVVTYV